MGSYTNNNYFYKPARGAKGASEKAVYDDALAVADAAIATNNTHRNSLGSDHTWLQQDVDTDASVVFAGLNITGTGTVATLVLSSGPAVTAICDDTGLTANSDLKLVTQQAIKAYVDAQVAVENLWDRVGTTLQPTNTGDSVNMHSGNIIMNAKGYFSDNTSSTTSTTIIKAGLSSSTYDTAVTQAAAYNDSASTIGGVVASSTTWNTTTAEMDASAASWNKFVDSATSYDAAVTHVTAPGTGHSIVADLNASAASWNKYVNSASSYDTAVAHVTLPGTGHSVVADLLASAASWNIFVSSDSSYDSAVAHIANPGTSHSVVSALNASASSWNKYVNSASTYDALAASASSWNVFVASDSSYDSAVAHITNPGTSHAWVNNNVKSGHTVFNISYILNGGGSAISTGNAGWFQVPVASTLKQIVLIGDQTGSITLDFWKDVYANMLPVAADSICGAGSQASISSDVKAILTGAALAGWTTSWSAGDIIAVHVSSCATTELSSILMKLERA